MCKSSSSANGGSQEDLGLIGSAITEERPLQRRGGVEGGAGGQGKKGPRHVVDVKGLLSSAIGEASAAVVNHVSMYVCAYVVEP